MEIHQEKLKPQSTGKSKQLYIFAIFIFILIALSLGFLKHKKPFLHIPILFLDSDNPCIQANIEGKKYNFALDTGADLFFSIKIEELNSIQKQEIGSHQTSDIKGNKYISSTFLINLINIGTIEISNVAVKEESISFLSEGSVLNKIHEEPINPEISGRVGAKFFRMIDYWLLDFPNSSLYAIRDIHKYFSFHNFVEAKLLEQTSPHIVIEIETSIGMKKFALDTGASRSIIRTPKEFEGKDHHILTTEQFKIGDHDFGPTRLYMFSMTPNMQFDGLLGRDFFKQHAVYLDFIEGKIYIPLPEKT